MIRIRLIRSPLTTRVGIDVDGTLERILDMPSGSDACEALARAIDDALQVVQERRALVGAKP